MRHSEFHRSHHIGWLRAAVLGANDGIISTSSLIIGIATAHATHQNILLTGMAGLVSGAMAMAAGEYVSVSSQADTETADLVREQDELSTQPEHELEELTGIYMQRGLTHELAKQVATQLTAHDALAAHARDELGIIDAMNARPIQAALASAGTFAIGAALPLLIAFFASAANIVPFVAVTSLAFLALLGGLAAKVGGANIWIGTGRVAFWGALAMAATAGVGSLFGVAIA
ncbi:VIT family protein [Methylotenera sp.]|uniref:VIT1/CCC1 transporter family protein n=1 Tax=Methylotenera sp. TaxID=2051956 RepID=UPI0024877591|nr:VIT family protein [Methylotenera sp.]MDI1299190.1 VIT family protein [Methylotenera sp.]